MSNPRFPVLLATADPSLAFLVQEALEQCPGLDLPLTQVDSLEPAVQGAAGNAYGLVIVEHALLDGGSVTALARLRAAAPGAPLVVAGGDEEPPLEQWVRDDGHVEHLTTDELDARGMARIVRGTARAAADAVTRRLYESTLNDARQRYRSLLSHSTTPTWELDLSGVARFLEARRREGLTDLRAWFEEYPAAVALCADEVQQVAVNDAALAFYGGASTSELAQACGIWAGFGNRDAFTEAVARFAAGDGTFELETEQRTVAGETRPVRLRITTPAGYNGSLARVFVAVEDRRPGLRAEERVCEAEARVAEALAEAAEAEAQRRRTEEELHALQLRHHEASQETEQLRAQLAEIEQGLEESARRIEEMEQRCAEESRRATLAAQDREFAEERLEVATKRVTELTAAYQALVRSIPIPVIACDASGTVTAWNAAAERLFGWCAKEAIGSFNPLFADGERDAYRRELRDRIESGATREIEAAGRLTRAGARIDLRLSCVPLVGSAGEALGEVASVLAARPARAVVEALV